MKSMHDRIHFLTAHWHDAMGWIWIPLWCVVASEGLFAARIWQFQLAMFAGGIGLSWLWYLGLSPFLESRIGVVRLLNSPANSKVRWKLPLLFLIPYLLLYWLIAHGFDRHPRIAPVGWSESHLFFFLCCSTGTLVLQIVDATNPWTRRAWYVAALLFWTVETASLGYWPVSYTAGYLLFGLTQSVLAIADLWLLMQLAAPMDGESRAEVPHA